MKRFSHSKLYSLDKSVPDECIERPKKHQYLSSEMIDVDGRPLKHSVVSIDDPFKRFEGMRIVDFSLENKLALGVELNPVKLDISSLDSADMFEDIVNQLDKQN